MATASLLSSSLFISKPSSPSSVFLHLPVKRFVSSSAQFRKRYGAVVSATWVATEPAKIQFLSKNGNVEQTQMTAEAEKVRLPTNESNEQLLRIRHTVSYGICDEKENLIWNFSVVYDLVSGRSAQVMAMAVQKLYPDAKVR